MSLVLSGTTLAAISACAPAQAGTPLTELNGTANGCASVDLSFQNFNVSGTASSGALTAPSLANTGVYVTATAPVGNVIGTAGITINPLADSDWQRTMGANSVSMSGTISWVAYANTGGTYGSGTPYSTPNPGYTWFFDAIGLATSGTVSGAGTISVAQTICLNSTTTASCATDSQGIVTATYGTGAGSTPTFSCMGSALMACSGGNSSLDILNSAQVTHVAFSTTITLNRPGSGVVDLNSFTANIDQFAGVATPEPAAFGLVAAALAAVGIRRRIWRG